SVLFATTIVLSYLTHLSIPFLIEPSVVSAYALALTYAALSVPFVMSGIVVSLALTRFPVQIGSLYAAYLAGAALGCLLVGPILRVTDAPTAVLVTAALTAVAAVLFAHERQAPEPARGTTSLARLCITLAVLMIVAAGAHAVAARRNAGWLRLMWAKGQY